MNLFATIGNKVDNTLNGIVELFTPSKKPKRKMNGRITDAEALDIMRADYSPIRAEQLRIIHRMGYGLSQNRLAKLHAKVTKEAVASNTQSNIKEKQL